MARIGPGWSGSANSAGVASQQHLQQHGALVPWLQPTPEIHYKPNIELFKRHPQDPLQNADDSDPRWARVIAANKYWPDITLDSSSCSGEHVEVPSHCSGLGSASPDPCGTEPAGLCAPEAFNDDPPLVAPLLSSTFMRRLSGCNLELKPW